MSSKKLKLYEKAYKKCISSCNMNDKKCKNKCKSLLSFNFKLKSPKRSRSKKLNPYQKFVKKEYPKHKNLDNTEIFKVIADKWNKKNNK